MPCWTISQSGLHNDMNQHLPLSHLISSLPHLPQSVDALDALLHRVIDLGLGGESADAESNARVSQVVLGADGPQHVRRFERGRRAGTAEMLLSIYPCVCVCLQLGTRGPGEMPLGHSGDVFQDFDRQICI